ncbi:MAG: DUF4230 domain-containing protein [Myxococcaceae bacterium]
MKRLLVVLVMCLVCFVLGAGLVLMRTRGERASLPDTPALVLQMREVMRLETLDVSLYKKVSFEPDPAEGKTVWADLYEFARYTLVQPKGRAIVFADVHLGFDLSRLDQSSLRIDGNRIDVVLPPVQAKAELKPGETEVIGSNLDSAGTAKLFELATDAFEREALADPKLKERARTSGERQLRALLTTLGFREVRFVDRLAVTGAM